MTSKLKFYALALAIACIPFKALATGNLDCTINDTNLDFTFESLFSYSGNGPLFQSKLSFQSKNEKTYATLKTLDQDRFRLIQQWVEGKDLRLQFYAETEGDGVPFAAVKLTIEATAGEDEISYAGGYRLEITPAVVAGGESEKITLNGKTACSAG